jgi:hypothetical protein
VRDPAKPDPAVGDPAKPDPAAGDPAKPDPVAGDPAKPDQVAAERVLRAADSPSARAVDLLQALSDRRARVLASREASGVSGVSGVHRSGSPSALADRRVVESLRRAGLRWEGLRLEVGRASYLTGSSTEAVIRGRVDWTAYTVVDATGVRSQEPPELGELLDFHLVRGPEGWRIDSISAARAS